MARKNLCIYTHNQTIGFPRPAGAIMDELEEGAAAHSKYERTNADWLNVMAKAIFKAMENSGTDMFFWENRKAVYKDGGVPDAVARDLDGRVLIDVVYKGRLYDKESNNQ